MLARDKAEQIKEAFRDWIFKEPKRRKNMWIFIMKPLTATDNEAMMALFKTAGTDPPVKVRPYQKNAVARALLCGLITPACPYSRRR